MLPRALLIIALPALVLLAAALHSPPAEQPAEYHLQKIDAQGRALGAWSGPWSCVCDTRTGLLWETKTDDEGIHDGYWTYSWFHSGIGVANSGDCYFEPERCDTDDLIRHTNREKLCGVDSWRLPSTEELQSLVYAQAQSGQPLIDTDYFPMTKRSDYWTREAAQPLQGVYRYLHMGSSAINSIDGNKVTIPYRNAAFVRLVSEVSSSCHLSSQ